MPICLVFALLFHFFFFTTRQLHLRGLRSCVISRGSLSQCTHLYHARVCLHPSLSYACRLIGYRCTFTDPPSSHNLAVVTIHTMDVRETKRSRNTRRREVKKIEKVEQTYRFDTVFDYFSIGRVFSICSSWNNKKIAFFMRGCPENSICRPRGK